MSNKKSKPSNGNGRGRKSKKDSEEIVSIPLRHEFAEDLETKFANHLIVQYHQHEYIVSFFEVHPPIRLADSREERQQELEQLEFVKASCVSRIAVASGRMSGFIAAMLFNLKNNAPEDFSTLSKQAQEQASEESNE